MRIISLLQKWRSLYKQVKYERKANNLSFLKQIVEANSNLTAITINKEELVLNLKNGLKFSWDPSKPNSCLGLAEQSNYETLELEIIKKIMTPKATVFDIGANFGYFSNSMQHFCDDIKIYSFEPIKSAFSLLERNLALNGFDKISTYNFGFSDQNKEVIFYVPDQLGTAWASMGTGVAKHLTYKLREELGKVERLSDFVERVAIEQVDFIKCDVEGAEKLVVLGAREVLLTHKPNLMLEIGDKWSASFGYKRQELIDLLIDEFGYCCFGIWNNKVIGIANGSEALSYSENELYNYFFIHPFREASLTILKELTLEH